MIVYIMKRIGLHALNYLQKPSPRYASTPYPVRKLMNTWNVALSDRHLNLRLAWRGWRTGVLADETDRGPTNDADFLNLANVYLSFIYLILFYYLNGKAGLKKTMCMCIYVCVCMFCVSMPCEKAQECDRCSAATPQKKRKRKKKQRGRRWFSNWGNLCLWHTK